MEKLKVCAVSAPILRTAVAIALGLIGVAHSVKAGTIFSFQFDNQGINAVNLHNDGPIVPPVVGTGQLVSPIDLAPGTYDLTALPGFTADFSFSDGQTYNQADITTPIAGVAVTVDVSGRLFFTESGAAGSDGGPWQGALDLFNGSTSLTFEPSVSGGNFLYAENGPTGYGGRYSALATPEPTPEPASVPLLASGLIALMLVGSRRRKNATS
jgi:hypothetical protein